MGRRGCFGRKGTRLRLFLERELDDEAGAAAGRGLGADAATVGLDDGADDVQPESEAGEVALAVGLIEAVEDALSVFGWDAGAVVADGKAQPGSSARRAVAACRRWRRRGDVDFDGLSGAVVLER